MRIFGTDSSTGLDGYEATVTKTGSAVALDVNVVSGSGDAVTIADGADVALGSTTDAANTTGTTGTLIGMVRGLLQSVAAVVSIGSGWVKVSIQNATLSVAGTKTNNNAAPSATQLEALTAVANATAPTWTEGNEVANSVNLKGQQRTIQVSTSFTTPTQVSVTNSATLIAAANVNRTRLTITTMGTTPVYLGASGVTSSTGDFLPGILGFPKLIRTTAAIYGITASGSQSVSVFEETA